MRNFGKISASSKGLGKVAFFILVIFIASKVGKNIFIQPEETTILCFAGILLLLGSRDRVFAAATVIAIIFFEGIFNLPISLAKMVGGGLIAYHLGVDILKKKISLDNNLFLFGYAFIFVISGLINDMGFLTYPNKVLLFNLATYFMIRYFLRDMEDVEKFLRMYCYVILTVSIVVFFQGRGGERLLVTGETISEFGNSSNIFGFLMSMSIPSAFYFSLFSKNPFHRTALRITTVFFVFLLIWTASRVAMVGLLASILVLTFSSKGLSRRGFLKPLIVFGIIAVVLIPSEVLQYSTARYLNQTPGTRASTESRIALTLGSLKAVPENPILGVGPIGEGMRTYLFPYTGYYKPSHSTPLSLLLKTGCLGFCFFYLALLHALFGLRKSVKYFKGAKDDKNTWLTVIIGVTLFSYIISSTFLHTADFKPLYVFLGIAQVINDRARQNIRGEKS
jgi:O-antigen ligase